MTNGQPPVVAFDQVSKSFGAKQILSEVSWSIPEGEALCILGRSGTGKSVTLKLLMSLLKPEKGRIWIEQEDVTQLGCRELSRVRHKMGFLFQDAALFDSLTLYENLLLPLLTLFMDFSGLAGGFVSEFATSRLSLQLYLSRAFAEFQWANFWPPTLKTCVFGFTIGTVASFFGYTTNEGAQGVGKAATRSVVVSSLLIILLDVLLIKLIFFIFPESAL